MQRNQDKITKTSAKSDWYLNEKDLENVEYEEARNPRYKCASPMALYKINDIKTVFCNKYNIQQNEESIQLKLNEIEKVKNEKRIKRQQNKNNKEAIRRNDLQECFNRYNLEIRNDSKLCSGYIDGTLKDWTCEQIARRTMEMKFLFENNNMYDEINKIKNSYREIGEYYNYDKVFERAEYNILKRYGGRYPF